MTYTSPPTKTNGVDSISKAEMNSYVRDNIEHLRTRATVKADAPDLSSSSGTGVSMDFSAGTEDWDTDSIHGASDHFSLNNVETGLWYVGATAKWDENTTGDRRLRMYESVTTTLGSVITDYRVKAPAKKCRLSAGTVYSFNSSDPDYRAHGLQTSGGALDLFGTGWALFVGGTTSNTDEFNDLALTDAQGVTAWWNSMGDNMDRLYNRPAARVRRNAAYNVPDASWTTVPFDTEVYDTAAMVGADKSKIVVPTGLGGYYYVHGCVRLDNYNGTTDLLQAQFLVDGTAQRLFASTSEVNTGDGSVNVEGILDLDAGAELTLRVYQDSGAVNALDASVTTHMGCFLLSGKDSTITNRQYFPDGLPDTNYSFTDPTSTFLPRGLTNVMARDYLAHLWNPPVIGAYAIADDTTVPDDGWATCPCREVLHNAWGETEMPSTQWLVENGLELPMDGVWLVTAQGWMAADGVGSTGNRGMKFLHRSFSESPIRFTGPTKSTGDFGATSSGLVNGTKGDKIILQLLQGSGDEIPITNASITAAWVRDKI